MTTVRRVITGETDDGKGVFLHEEEVTPLESHIRWFPIWGWDAKQVVPPDRSSQWVPGEPFAPVEAPDGLRISFTEFRPDDDPLNQPDPGDQVGKGLTGGRMRERDLNTKLHMTDSIDIVFIIEGEITLEEDEGEVTLRKGDCLVQNGSRHAWRNRSGAPALLGFVTLAAERA